MKVFIKTARQQDGDALEKMLGGVKAHHTVRELKVRIAMKWSIPAYKQRLVFAGEELADEKSVSAYNIQNGAIIHLVVDQHRTRKHRKCKGAQQKSVSVFNSNLPGTKIQPQNSSFQIYVQIPGATCSEQTRVLDGVLASDEIKTVKERASMVTGYPADSQRLIFCGKELDNNKTVQDYQIQNNYTIQMAVKVKGG